MSHHRLLRRPSTTATALALFVAFAVAACASSTPTAPPTMAPTAAPTQTPAGPTASPRPAAEVYAEIRAAVEKIRGLTPTAAVDPVTIDAIQLRANLASEFDAENKPADLRNAEDELIALGLLPAGASLRTLTLDFEGGQVAGYYSPEKDQLFVVNRSGGGVGAAEMVTYAHEFTHQLQDQQIHLDSLGLNVHDQADRSLGRLALVEGDAVSVQTTWMTANLTAQQLGELMRSALDPAAMAALQNAPAYLRETALFPYNDGLTFVNRLLASGGYTAVDAAFRDPPNSTEQVLHPDKYVAREAPLKVVLPASLATDAGAGWSLAAQDTLGELILRVWLVQNGVTAADARSAAAGWGGDRLALLRGPDGAVAVALRTDWDSAADAQEFATAARTAIGHLQAASDLAYAPGSTVVVLEVGLASGDILVPLAKG